VLEFLLLRFVARLSDNTDDGHLKSSLVEMPLTARLSLLLPLSKRLPKP
jgi:hypothetical protein